MNTTFFAGGLAATPVIFALALGQTQDPQRDKQNEDSRFPRSQVVEGDQRASQQVEQAYDQLHRSAVNALVTRALDWKAGGSSVDGSMAGSRDGSAADSARRIQLETSDLLIAACPNGLIAGAPTATASVTGRSLGEPGYRDEDSAAGSDMARDERPEQGQIVGMLLVCATSSNDSSARFSGSHASSTRPGDTAQGGPAESGPASRANRGEVEAGHSMGRLEPGAYAIARSGDAVRLTDEQGKTVLRANLGNPPTSRPGSSGTSSDHPTDWPHLFGAITHEVMGSMGWGKHSRTAAR